jgi:hypothetical protein
MDEADFKYDGREFNEKTKRMHSGVLFIACMSKLANCRIISYISIIIIIDRPLLTAPYSFALNA